MKIVIIGAGEVGYSLAQALLRNKHQVTMIESEPARCNGVVKLLNTVVIHGDGTTLSTLADAELDKADILIALTGRDQDNLIACQLASNKFHVPRTVARVNRPQNRELFGKLGGVDTAVSTTEIISSIVEEEVSLKDIVTIQSFKNGNVAIVKLEIGDQSPAKEKHIVDIDFPKDCVLMCIFRGNEVIFPRGMTRFESGDRVLAITTRENKLMLRNVLVGENSSVA